VKQFKVLVQLQRTKFATTEKNITIHQRYIAGCSLLKQVPSGKRTEAAMPTDKNTDKATAAIQQCTAELLTFFCHC